MNGRLPTFDYMKDRSDESIGRRLGSVIQFVRTRVAKRHRPPKILQMDIVAKSVLNIDVALLLENFR